MSRPGQSNETHPYAPRNKQEQKRIESELRKRDMFEHNMSFQSMKELLDAVIQSEETSNIKDHTAEINNLEAVPTMTYAQKTGNSALSSTEQKSMSPELSGVHQNKKLLQEKSMDSSDDSTLYQGITNPSTKESREPHNVNKNKPRSTLNIANKHEGMNNNNNNKRKNQRQNIETRPEDRWPKFKINPLDFINNTKDTDLIPHTRSFKSQTSREGDGGGAHANNERATQAHLYNHLLRIAEICHNQQRSSVVTNFQWGSAIKIGETKGSFDRKILSADESPEFDDDKKQPEATTSFGLFDDTKRRRKLCTNSASIYDYEDDSGDEQDDNDEDFVLTKKRQKGVGSSTRKKTAGTRKSAEPASTSKGVVAAKKEREDHVTSIDIADQCVSTDDEGKDEPPKKVRRSKSVETEDVYPRRIVPPKPGPKWINVKARKPLNESRITKRTQNENEENARTRQTNKSRTGLQEEDIATALEEDDKDNDGDSLISLNDSIVDIRPLRISSRMKMQSQRLVQLQENEREMEMKRDEQEKIKQERIRHEKIERVQQRLKEEKVKQKVQEELEKQKTEREKEWNNFLAQGNKKRTVERIDLYPDGRPQNNEISQTADEQNSIVVDSDDDFISDNGPNTHSDSNHVRCPICSRTFAASEIEAHAGACEEYDDCPPGMSRSSSPSLTPTKKASNVQGGRSSILLECEICSRFTTYNGKEFENHMTECLRRKKYSEPFAPPNIVEVPNSPIRSLRTISEQPDSEINYKSQFVVKTRSNKTVGKKRKR